MTPLKEKQLEALVERTVIRVLRRALIDPDFGLEIRPEFEKKLKKSIASARAGRLQNGHLTL